MFIIKMFGCKRNAEEEAQKDIDDYLISDHEKQKQIHQLLLLGTGESGKTTILKQMKIIHINGFTDQERQEKIVHIRENVRESIHDIVYHMDKINPPVNLEKEENRKLVQDILNIGLNTDIDLNQDYFDKVSILWQDKGVKAACERANEYQLIDCASYFLDRLDDVRKPDYIPTTQDILHCRIKTINISTIEFKIQVTAKKGGGTAHFALTDVGGQRGARKKWISVFDGIESVLFLIAASDFDQKLREDDSTNRLIEAFNVFQSMFWNKFLRSSGMIVFLNKQDILKKKIESGKSLGQYFPNYEKYVVKENAKSEYEKAKLFMKNRIIEITKTKPAPELIGLLPFQITAEVKDKSVYIHFTTATDTNNIQLVFESVRDIILDNLLQPTGNIF